MPVFTSTAGLRHATGPGHPEQVQRLTAVLERLAADGIAVTEAAPATIDPLLARHPLTHLRRLHETADRGATLDPDTPVGPGSWDAVLGATGATHAALRHVMVNGGGAFVAIRPPGHHALAAQAMGFCLVNHAAVLASSARAEGRERVLIVDWDVHHGNGTQALIEQEANTRFVSMHQWPWYPGTGAADERGVGNCFNVPLGPGLPRAVYVDALWAAVVTSTTGWTPDVVIVSAGYDAMQGDPLGGFTLEPADYATWTKRLAERFQVPTIAVMEGGYVPRRLADGVVATVRAMA